MRLAKVVLDTNVVVSAHLGIDGIFRLSIKTRWWSMLGS
jgi:predicted nucleic acid-binding protein